LDGVVGTRSFSWDFGPPMGFGEGPAALEAWLRSIGLYFYGYVMELHHPPHLDQEA
jgi:hypothetical protein